MKEEPMSVKEFLTDQSMLPDRVWTVSLKIGIMPDDDHVQFELEVTNARTDELMKLYTIHHRGMHHAVDGLNEILRELRVTFREMSGPFF